VVFILCLGIPYIQRGSVTERLASVDSLIWLIKHNLSLHSSLNHPIAQYTSIGFVYRFRWDRVYPLLRFPLVCWRRGTQANFDAPEFYGIPPGQVRNFQLTTPDGAKIGTADNTTSFHRFTWSNWLTYRRLLLVVVKFKASGMRCLRLFTFGISSNPRTFPAHCYSLTPKQSHCRFSKTL
jgi:hypothetical protein